MRKIIFITLLFCFTGLNAQYVKPYFNILSIENGLPEGYVVSSLQDKLGYMWLGTQNGLVRYDGYELKSYPFPDDNGLPLIYCSIRQLHEDKEGKLWALVTSEGLFYLNRQKDAFIKVPLDSADINIFKDHYFSKWIEDQKNDRHWLLGINSKNFIPCLYAFDAQKNKFKKYGPDCETNQHIPMHKYADILQDSEKKIWVAADSLLSFFDPSSNSFKPWFVVPGSTKNIIISSITSDPGNNEMMWVTTLTPDVDLSNNPNPTKFFHVNTKTKEYKSFKHIENDPTTIAGNCINIINDSLNRTWFSTDKGISLFNPQSETFINYNLNLPATTSGNKTNVEIILADKEANIWLGGNFNGLFYLDVNTAKATIHLHGNEPGSLPDSPRGINNLFYDQSGTLWISMPWQGIAYLDHQKSMINSIPIEPTLSEVNKITGQDDFNINGKYGDSIYFISNTSGLFKWNYKQNSFKRIELNNNNFYGQIKTVFVAKDGLIWIVGRSEGLFCYNPMNKSVKNFTNDPNDSTSLSSNSINVMVEDNEGDLWIGTDSKGLCRFNITSSTFTRFPFINNNGTMHADNVLDDNRVLSLFFEKEGILWIGTNQGGLNRLDTKTEKFTSYLDRKTGLNCVVNIYEDSHNRMWVGTYLSGLFLFDRETGNKRRYSEQDGLLFNSVMGIVEDNRSNIWTASARGLSMLNPESNSITNFHIPIGDLRSNNILFRGTDGLMQVPIKNGLISFDPEKMNASNVPPSIVIESLGYTNANNKDTTIFTDGKEQIELQYNENKISFQYVGLHYADSELNQYAYMLVGYDKEWIQSGTQRTATYTNLSPGNYMFNVKSANSDGVWNETGTHFSITIAPPWWQTTLAYLIYGILFIAAVIIVDRFQRKRLREKEHTQTREKELAQAKEIEKAYHKLKTTQKQLLHSEKMASLGELTAGIAHEIQNPLNFVNNFSEVNAELIAELKEEIEKGDKEEAMAIAIDIAGNEEKINHHGKRADGIVKGMLQHSRTSNNEKEMTDINVLADEYLRLAYHGLRAKDKSFNADFKADLDMSLPKINVIPQDIGRVLLNLVNNAFYAVSEEAPAKTEGYKPTVIVSTKRLKNKVEIKVKDNGNGIPTNVKDKIFQPFFTTKPTGEGTGLGLSLSYDIITKGHNGELKVETIEGEGTEFIIQLPSN